MRIFGSWADAAKALRAITNSEERREFFKDYDVQPSLPPPIHGFMSLPVWPSDVTPADPAEWANDPSPSPTDDGATVVVNLCLFMAQPGVDAADGRGGALRYHAVDLLIKPLFLGFRLFNPTYVAVEAERQGRGVLDLRRELEREAVFAAILSCPPQDLSLEAVKKRAWRELNARVKRPKAERDDASAHASQSPLDESLVEGGVLKDLPGVADRFLSGQVSRADFDFAFETDPLTPAEADVIAMLCVGYSPNETASRRGVSPKTVYELRKRARVKLLTVP